MPLYKKIEHKYETAILMPELKRKKEKLETIRNIHQPLDYSQLREHARNYSQQRAETLEKRKIEREKKFLENIDKYQNVWNIYNCKFSPGFKSTSQCSCCIY